MMLHTFRKSPLAMLAMGLWIGLLATWGLSRLSSQHPLDISQMVPTEPVHATSTDRCETVAMATGPVDEEVEAVYVLDFLTGELNAFVMGKQGNGFQAKYNINVMQYMQVNPAKNPKFLMTTGLVTMRRGAGQQPSLAAVYVAEVTTAQLACFVVPWQVGLRNTRQMVNAKLIPMGKAQFRNMPMGPGAPTVGGGIPKGR